MIDFDTWKAYIDTQDYNPLFVTVSGAHLYGFDSPDSDIDLRGCHLMPLREIVGLTIGQETFEREHIYAETEVDIVSHDVGKYLRLLVKNNGYILEQVFSPLIVCGHDFLEQLRPIAERCITKHHYHHYHGFYGTQRKLIEKQERKTAKAVLYAYRVLMTGIHLMQTGEVLADIHQLNSEFKLSCIDELVAAKTEEKIAPESLDWPYHAKKLGQLEAKLDEAFDGTQLGDSRDTGAVNQLLLELRLGETA